MKVKELEIETQLVDASLVKDGLITNFICTKENFVKDYSEYLVVASWIENKKMTYVQIKED